MLLHELVTYIFRFSYRQHVHNFKIRRFVKCSQEWNVVMNESRIQGIGHILFTYRTEIFINTDFRFQSLVTAHARQVLVFLYGQKFKYTAARSLTNRLDSWNNTA
jgi:hypothetical protein